MRLHPILWTAATLDTVSFLRGVHTEVLAGQRMGRMTTRSTLAWDRLGRQLLQQLVHELFAEA